MSVLLASHVDNTDSVQSVLFCQKFFHVLL